uniref:hypothetical protein n=1 Tax=Candidatus Bartonella washoeensis TaxID=186739 RepID=UPI00131E08FA|nr:hypothetical protein [Bartonella washoeensis]
MLETIPHIAKPLANNAKSLFKLLPMFREIKTRACAIPRAKPLTKEEKRSQYFHKTKQLARITATTAAIKAPIGLKTAPTTEAMPAPTTSITVPIQPKVAANAEPETISPRNAATSKVIGRRRRSVLPPRLAAIIPTERPDAIKPHQLVLRARLSAPSFTKEVMSCRSPRRVPAMVKRNTRKAILKAIRAAMVFMMALVKAEDWYDYG